MKKLTFIFALLCASVMGFAIDWSGISYVPCDAGGDAYANKFKVQKDEGQNVASIQNFKSAGWGIYTSFNEKGAITSVSGVSSYEVEGAGVCLHCSSFDAGETAVTVTCASGSFNFTVYKEADAAPEPTSATFSINTVLPSERVSATNSGDDFNVNIATYGGGQWQAQLKLEHNLSFVATKSYKVAYNLTADKDCGGITFKTDDNNGAVYENQSINLTANTPYHYEKVFVGVPGNNKIMVFDFGFVGENTNITISDLTLEEYSPATASSTNGDLIPFKAVDGNAGTRWQAASKGEAWWKMDYGTAQSFNRVNITWEWSYAKSFTIQGSNDDETYTVLKTVSGQTIASPNNYKQVIDLDQIYSYRYVKFVGTENANDYGFSFYEFEILEVETSVLTDVVYTYPKRKTVCAVGQSIDVTAVARDQYAEVMAGQTITYTVSPAGKGSIDANGHYTASAVGEVTITATCSDKSATAKVENTISGNLALNKDATAGHNETPVSEANDASLTSYWSLAPNRPVEEMWWQVDLEQQYDLSLVIIKWDGACPTEHAIQVSANGSDWTDAATKSGWPEIGTAEDHNYQFYPINATGQYIRVKASALRNNGWGMKIFDFQAFGTLAATPTKSVSATPNNVEYGSASVVVKSSGLAPEGGTVETGTEVTFSATPNDGYIFVNWSNGETNASFDAVVNSAMNLTANFRALGNIYCNTEVTSTRDEDVHVAYATMKRTSTNNYKLVVRSTEALGKFSNTTLQVNGNENLNLNNQGTLTDDYHVLTYEFTSTTPPSMTSGYMYLNVPGSKFTECWFTRLTNIEYEVPCDDENVPVESISLNYTETTIEIGNTQTLVVMFNPAYATDKTITWTSTNSSVVSVDNGVVTANAIGTATITAETSNGKTATCEITVDPITAKTWWGTQTITDWDPDMDVMWSVTRNANKTLTYTVYYGGDASGYVVRQLNDGGYNDLTGYTDENRVASYTTAATYEKGDQLFPNPFFYFGGPRIDLPTSYRVGDSNDKPATSVSSVSLNRTAASLEPTEQLQLTASILPSFVENKAVTWTSSNSDIASVTDDGLVTANAVGTATITATSSADNTKKATCTITVVGDLNPETLYGYGKFNVHGKWVAFNYSITRTAERNLYYQTHLSEDIDGIAMKINYNDNWYTMTQDDSKRNATYTENGPFVDGNAHNFYFRAEFTNGADNNNVTYTIASYNDALPQAIAVDEDKDNEAVLAAYDDQTVIGIVGRSFAAGNLYTLVLPFDVDAAQTAAKLPGHLTKLQNTIVKENEDLRINFVDASAIEAGVPYLYEPSAAVANPTFEGVEVSATLHPTVADSHAKYYGIYAPMNGDALHVLTDAYVLGPDQYLYAVSDLPDDQTMAALRGYFVLNFPSAPAGAPKRLAKVVFNYEETEILTGIENTIDNEQNAKILRDGQLLIIREGKTYNAQGQLIK